MIALRPRDQPVWDPRPLPHETDAETKTNCCETETETKKVVSRPTWSRDLNIPVSSRFTCRFSDSVPSPALNIAEGLAFWWLSVIECLKTRLYDMLLVQTRQQRCGMYALTRSHQLELASHVLRSSSLMATRGTQQPHRNKPTSHAVQASASWRSL